LPSRKREFHSGHFYHVYNRGNEGKEIFFERENYIFFLKRMSTYFTKNQIIPICYCLMPNHFHLLVLQNSHIPISIPMSSLSTSYAKAVNKRYNRIGHLFQERYQCKLIDKTEYLLYLTRYIHLNPVRSNLVEKPENWEFSSYLDFIERRNGKLSNPELVFDMFYGNEIDFSDTSELARLRKDYQDFVYSDEEIKNKIKPYLFP
jgi:putative transposase